MPSISKQAKMLHFPALLIGLGLCAVLLVPYFFIASYAAQDEGVNDFDLGLAKRMKQDSDGNPTKAKWMHYVTYLGDKYTLAAVALLGVIWQVWRGRRWLAVAWCLIALGGYGLNEAVKEAAHRARPDMETLRDPEILKDSLKSFSFPSGHSMGSMIGYGLLGYAMVLGARRRLYAVLPLVELPVIVAAVGFSRMYLRAHWTTDVLAGWLLGAAWLALTLGIAEAWRRGRERAAAPGGTNAIGGV